MVGFDTPLNNGAAFALQAKFAPKKVKPPRFNKSQQSNESELFEDYFRATTGEPIREFRNLSPIGFRKGMAPSFTG